MTPHSGTMPMSIYLKVCAKTTGICIQVRFFFTDHAAENSIFDKSKAAERQFPHMASEVAPPPPRGHMTEWVQAAMSDREYYLKNRLENLTSFLSPMHQDN